MKTIINFKSIESFSTEKLDAFKVTGDDFQNFLTMHNDTNVMATLGGLRTAAQTQENLDWNLTQWKDNGFGLWMFYLKDTKEWVGRAGLRRVEVSGCEEIELGYALMPQFWNKGFATEMAKACLEIAFEILGLDNIVSFTLKTNKNSESVMRKVGFQYERDIIHVGLPHVLYRVKVEAYAQKKIAHQFSFKPLQEKDLNLLCKWFHEPHVKEWWNDHLSDAEIKSKYGGRIGDTIVAPFIVELQDRPIGFIQYYEANKVGGGWWPDEVEGTFGIDQFIGEKDLIDRGIGTDMIRTFIKYLFLNPKVKKIITDVDPKNLRAIRCYEKSGFVFVKEMKTPEGLVYLMELNRHK